MTRQYGFREGVHVALPRDCFMLHMKHWKKASEIKATSDNFDALLDLRTQAVCLGYQMISLLLVEKEK